MFTGKNITSAKLICGIFLGTANTHFPPTISQGTSIAIDECNSKKDGSAGIGFIFCSNMGWYKDFSEIISVMVKNVHS